jgi:molybdopterin converting factor small subunit
LNETTTNLVRVKLIGVLGSAAGRREIDLEWSGPLTLSDLLGNLLKTVDNKEFQDFLIDSGTNDPRPNVIILLNERDCNLFNGLKTKIEKGITVTIIPVAHGG